MLQRFRRWLAGDEAQVGPPQPAYHPQAQANDQLVAESLRACREDITRLRDEVAQLQLDWASTLDKMKKWANRQAAREKAAYDQAMAATEVVPGSSTPEPPSNVRMMDKAQLRQLAALQRNGGHR